MKKFLASLVTALLSFSALVGLFAESASASVCLYMTGQGSQISPWQVKTPEDLARIGKSYLSGGCESSFSENHFYKLMNDIHLVNDHVPVDLISETGYLAEFDGDGHEINGLNIALLGELNESYVGLFGKTKNATIKNLKIRGGHVSAKNYIGSLAGYMLYSHVENVMVSMSESVVGNNHVGGLIGTMSGGTVSNVSFMSAEDVTATGYEVGGAIGYAIGLTSIAGIGVKLRSVRASGVYSAGGIFGTFIGLAPKASLTNLAFIGNVIGSGPNGAVVADLYFMDGDGDPADGELSISNTVIRGNLDASTASSNGLFVGRTHETEASAVNVEISNSYISFASISEQPDGRAMDGSVEVALGATSADLSSVLAEVDSRSLTEIYDVSAQVIRLRKFDDGGAVIRRAAASLPAGWQAKSRVQFDSEDSGGQWVVDESPLSPMNAGIPMPAAIYQLGLFDLCQEGTFSADGATPCQFAEPGTFVSGRAALLSQRCDVGTYQPSFGSRECLLAEPGKFVADVGAMQAVPCPSGYTSAAGASSCYLIPQSIGSSTPVVTTPPAVTPATVTKVTVKRIGNRVSISMISAKLLVVKLNGKFVVSQQANKLLKKSVALLKGKNKLEIFEGGKVLKRTNYTR